MKKTFRKNMFLALALVPVLLAGCGAAPDYPIIEIANKSSNALASVDNDGVIASGEVRFSYPSDGWSELSDTPLGSLAIVYDETFDTNNRITITVSLTTSSKIKRDLKESDIEDLVQNVVDSEYGDSVTIDLAEMRLLNDKPVIYTEITSRFTSEWIDHLIATGVYTERDIEAAGGREALIAAPPTAQITIYTVAGQYCYQCTGTYYDETQKQMVFDALTIVVSTLEGP